MKKYPKKGEQRSHPTMWWANISPDHAESKNTQKVNHTYYGDLQVETPRGWKVGTEINPYPAIKLKEPTLSDILGVEI